MQSKYTMLNYAFFYPIYISSLLSLELRLFSYEIKLFNMAYEQINVNSSLNILDVVIMMRMTFACVMQFL